MAYGGLGTLLKATRKQLGLSQAAAAKRADVSVRLWAEVERGERENVSFQTTLRMLGEMGIEVLLEGPAGDRIGVTTGDAADRAREVRAAIRRATWTGRKLRLGDDDDSPTAGPGTHPVEAVHEISMQAYAVAAAATVSAKGSAQRRKKSHGRSP
jgi:transcriptional regulator with XRE-family HTH domain